MEEKQKTVDQVMLDRMKEIKVETMYDRYEAQLPQCGYGSLALCCRHCNYGPCNIDPFGKGPKKGVCGADANKWGWIFSATAWLMPSAGWYQKKFRRILWKKNKRP